MKRNFTFFGLRFMLERKAWGTCIWAKSLGFRVYVTNHGVRFRCGA